MGGIGPPLRKRTTASIFLQLFCICSCSYTLPLQVRRFATTLLVTTNMLLFLFPHLKRHSICVHVSYFQRFYCQPKVIIWKCTCVHGISWLHRYAMASEEHYRSKLHRQRCGSCTWNLSRLCPWQCSSISQNKHYIMADKLHDPEQQFVADDFIHHSIGHSGFVYAHLLSHQGRCPPSPSSHPNIQPTCTTCSSLILIGSQMAQSCP